MVYPSHIKPYSAAWYHWAAQELPARIERAQTLCYQVALTNDDSPWMRNFATQLFFKMPSVRVVALETMQAANVIINMFPQEKTFKRLKYE